MGAEERTKTFSHLLPLRYITPSCHVNSAVFETSPPKESTLPSAAERVKALKGLQGVSMNKDSGMMILTFTEIENARAAKWKLEEFSPVGLHVIEGTLTDDNKRLRLNKVVKGE